LWIGLLRLEAAPDLGDEEADVVIDSILRAYIASRGDEGRLLGDKVGDQCIV